MLGAGYRQRGMSVLGMIATISFIVAAIVLVVRLAPHYIDFHTMRAVMDDLPARQVHEMDKRAVREMLDKRFRVNNLRSFRVRDVVSIDRKKAGTTIYINYEIREPLVGNADIVLKFKDEYRYQ